MTEDGAEYVTDAPITAPPQDRFSRVSFAERIARTISAQRDPASLVVGLYGVWGDGKTSVLNLVEHSLATIEGMVPVRFNPWRLGNESEMFVGFFETLAEALDTELTTGKQKVGDALKQYGALLKPVPIVGSAAGEAAAAAGAALSERSLTQGRGRIEKLLAESGKRVIILMDDLDRLDKGEIQAIFRLVKVAADFKHTAYLLAFDASVVEDALAERYAAGTTHGTNFMEKIIQLPLHLPPVGSELLRRVTLETVEVALEQAGIEMSTTDVGDFVSTFDRAVVPRIRTPRMGKRYGNAVLFALPMIGDEVRPADLLLIEGMRIFYPRLYEWVRTHENEVLGRTSKSQNHAEEANAVLRKAVEQATAGMTVDEVRGAEVLLTTLFPRTQSAWTNTHWGREWDPIWAHERRITSPQYFNRYFTYTVAAGDIRDADIDALIAMLEAPDHDREVAAEFVSQLIGSGSAETFLVKVGAHVSTVSPTGASHLVVLVTALSDQLPDRPASMGLSTLERAAMLTSKLVQRLASEDRGDLVEGVVRASPSIPFAVDVLRWARPRGDDAGTLTLKETNKAGVLLVERIISELEGDDPFGAFGRRLTSALHTWSLYGEAADVRARLAALIAADLSNAFRLMAAFLGQAWSMDTGVPFTPEFGREAYDALVEYIDPADLLSRFQHDFGEAVGTGDFYDFEELPSEERLANEFAFIHRSVLDQEKGDNQNPPEADQNG